MKSDLEEPDFLKSVAMEVSNAKGKPWGIGLGSAEVNDGITQLKKYGVIGPCSFDGCAHHATARCGWSNKCLKKGGCDELYCPTHSYTPQGSH